MGYFTSAIVCLSLVGHLGCVIDHKLAEPADDEGANDSTSGDGTSDDSATGQDNPGMTSAATSNTNGSGTSSETGVDSDTTFASLCEQYCGTGCLFGDSQQDCVLKCEQEFLEVNAAPLCTEALAAYLTCMVQAECVQESCWEQEEKMELECWCDYGGGGDGRNMCSSEWECYGISRSVVCADQTCTCYDGGEVTGTCDANGVCEDSIQPAGDFALECCGFDDYPEPGA